MSPKLDSMSRSETKDERIYIRINGKLKADMEKYATRHGISLSELTTRFYKNLLKHEKEAKKPKKTSTEFF